MVEDLYTWPRNSNITTLTCFHKNKDHFWNRRIQAVSMSMYEPETMKKAFNKKLSKKQITWVIDIADIKEYLRLRFLLIIHHSMLPIYLQNELLTIRDLIPYDHFMTCLFRFFTPPLKIPKNKLKEIICPPEVYEGREDFLYSCWLRVQRFFLKKKVKQNLITLLEDEGILIQEGFDVFVEGGLLDQKYGLSHVYVTNIKPKEPLTNYVFSESKDPLELEFWLVNYILLCKEIVYNYDIYLYTSYMLEQRLKLFKLRELQFKFVYCRIIENFKNPSKITDFKF